MKFLDRSLRVQHVRQLFSNLKTCCSCSSPCADNSRTGSLSRNNFPIWWRPLMHPPTTPQKHPYKSRRQYQQIPASSLPRFWASFKATESSGFYWKINNTGCKHARRFFLTKIRGGLSEKDILHCDLCVFGFIVSFAPRWNAAQINVLQVLYSLITMTRIVCAFCSDEVWARKTALRRNFELANFRKVFLKMVSLQDPFSYCTIIFNFIFFLSLLSACYWWLSLY